MVRHRVQTVLLILSISSPEMNAYHIATVCIPILEIELLRKLGVWKKDWQDAKACEIVTCSSGTYCRKTDVLEISQSKVVVTLVSDRWEESLPST